MTMENYQKSDIYEKMNQLIKSIASLNETIDNNEVIQLRYFLDQIAKSVPKSVEESLTKDRFIDKKRSLLQATTSLDEAKIYLSLLENFGYGKTQDIKTKVDEFNELLSRTIY